MVCRVRDSSKNAYRSIFTRWGSRSCPAATSTLYSGAMAGAHYGHSGSGYNSLCMAPNGQRPVGASSGNHNGNLLYGTEYENTGAIDKHHDKDAACAVCATTARSTHVVWGRTTCPAGGYKKEYSGFAMSTHYTQAAGETVCVDTERAYHAASSNANHNGNLLYSTEYESHSGQGPNDMEVSCVVCSISPHSIGGLSLGGSSKGKHSLHLY